jgi:hypothetical protein
MIMQDGLPPCPFCGDEHPEITSGDSVICTNSSGGCFASNSYEAWRRRNPTWTSKQPTVPGWYWARHPLVLDVAMVWVEQEAITRNEFMAGSQWAGPIREPGEEG